IAHLILVLEQASGRRSRRARAIFVIRAAVAGTHEQPRLSEPAHGAPEMRAIHREHLKAVALDVTHPACDFGGRAAPRDADGILVCRQARLASGESLDPTELDPRLAVRAAAGRAEDVADDRDAHEGSSQHVQEDAEAEQETSA